LSAALLAVVADVNWPRAKLAAITAERWFTLANSEDWQTDNQIRTLLKGVKCYVLEPFKRTGRECIAVRQAVRVHTAIKPTHMLFRRTMGVRLGHDAALALLLQAVAADRRIQRFGDAAGIQLWTTPGI
jgi:hypothetical protein